MVKINRLKMQDIILNDAILNKITSLVSQLDISLSEEQAQKLCYLVHFLAKWNKALNLTSIKTESEMVVLHILDSASISPLLGDAKNIADVGTGAGFPGLVLAILNPNKHFTLIDSIAKKISFVKMACVNLNLTNVTVLNTRCENISTEHKFDMIVSRAFAPLERMVNWCIHLLDDNGCFLAMKANLTDEEINSIPKSVKIDRLVSLKVPDLDAARHGVFLTKV